MAGTEAAIASQYSRFVSKLQAFRDESFYTKPTLCTHYFRSNRTLRLPCLGLQGVDKHGQLK